MTDALILPGPRAFRGGHLNAIADREARRMLGNFREWAGDADAPAWLDVDEALVGAVVGWLSSGASAVLLREGDEWPTILPDDLDEYRRETFLAVARRAARDELGRIKASPRTANQPRGSTR